VEEILGGAVSGYVGRLAPSPTGALKLGNVRTFMIAYLRARSLSGKVILRIEDLDHPRDKPGAAAAAIEDLKWLGFEWDDVFVQSERRAIYRRALEKLVRRPEPLAYPCVCSRRDVAAAQSAPHAGEQLYYPGSCRGRFSGWDEAAAAIAPRVPCWRFRTEGSRVVEFDDVFAGRFTMDVSAALGDFPLARDPDGAGYTLAVVVDDAEMGVTEVVRGDDLLPATPQQILVYRALEMEVPSFFHVPLVVGPDGHRLAKRHGDTRIASFRDAGMAAKDIIGYLAWSLGMNPKKRPVGLKSLTGIFDPALVPRGPLVFKGFT
jgi:glutamyl-tRNA synthetase